MARQTVISGAIAGVDQTPSEAIVEQYFDSFKIGDFEAVSQLFTPDGALQPPLENLIVGPAAIAAYLQQEAKGFVLQPLSSCTKLNTPPVVPLAKGDGDSRGLHKVIFYVQVLTK